MAECGRTRRVRVVPSHSAPAARHDRPGSITCLIQICVSGKFLSSTGVDPRGVDGDEEPRSGGVVTAERAPEDDAGAPGEAVVDGGAPAATAEPDDSWRRPTSRSHRSGEDAAAAEDDDAAAAPSRPRPPRPTSPLLTSPLADIPCRRSPARRLPDDAPAEAQPRSDDVADGPVAAARTSRRTHVRRGLVAAGVALVVAMSVAPSRCRAPATVSTDQTFVDAARTQGHVIAPGDQQTLIISAARKVCDRRESYGTAAERKATALSSAELVAIDQAFDTDVRGFTTLALNTYCAS